MSTEVEVLSGRKGSNPGGMCRIRRESNYMDCYLKYCPGSHLPKSSSLTARNQPIYEVITNVLIRRVGLLTPKTHILIDMNKDIHFKKLDGSKEGLGEGRRYYFVSELLKADESRNQELLRKTIDYEHPYLDLLGICDVFDKRDNFFFYEDDRGKVFYVDLGCSFVRAKEGWIELKNKDKRELWNKSNIKHAKKELENYLIIPAYNGSRVDIVGLIDSLPNIELSTINPVGKTFVKRIMPEEEIEEIKNILILDIDRGLRRYRKTHPKMIVRN